MSKEACSICGNDKSLARIGEALGFRPDIMAVEIQQLRARVAELEAIIAKAKAQAPVAWLNKHGSPSEIPTWGSRALYLNPFPEDV